MSAELAQVHLKLDMILNQLATFQPKEEKPMTIVAFAKRVGLSRWTIQKRIKARSILTKGSKIPPSELKKFGL
jgi:DNA-binding Lrp family transcriptional regulator